MPPKLMTNYGRPAFDERTCVEHAERAILWLARGDEHTAEVLRSNILSDEFNIHGPTVAEVIGK